ncbi:uncharacterized protein VICG_00972 [Vittaforma corneae ATCC 50505]|uniref:Zinc-ribbon 15 domain-containing protein n=1 Tax=Vittaforma corneae (strain ATCC 50505) TaxID=993615 RepID=L2GN79_VITCO|nr:uncharacterized protein VICG_00972 [Vittaforma corneae ATCC 50505]ELA41955.1 hypothetical protein VICG_00972 [Vittaforma corneae ATCC 50505]
MCECCCIPLGCISMPVTVETPEGYPHPPNKMLCSRCGHISKASYRQNRAYCGVLFIPCIPCGRGVPFLACSRCNFPCGNVTAEECSRCGVTTCYSVDYCPNCGTSRPGVPNNPKALTDSEIKTYERKGSDNISENHGNDENHADNKRKTIGEMRNK